MQDSRCRIHGCWGVELEVEVGVVLAVRGELVVGEVGEEGLELEEEAFAGEVAVGVHVEGQR